MTSLLARRKVEEEEDAIRFGAFARRRDVRERRCPCRECPPAWTGQSCRILRGRREQLALDGVGGDEDEEGKDEEPVGVEEEEGKEEEPLRVGDVWRSVPQGRKTEEGINPCRHASILGTHTLSLRSPVKGS